MLYVVSASSVINTNRIFTLVLYAVWRSSRFATTQSRLSIAVSAESTSVRGSIASVSALPQPQVNSSSRGWWDYVPEDNQSSQKKGDAMTGQGEQRSDTPDSRLGLIRSAGSRGPGILHKILSFLPSLLSANRSSTTPAPRKSSIHAQEPIPQPHAAKKLSRSSENTMVSEKPASTQLFTKRQGKHSFFDASASDDAKWIKALPNLVRHVVKDEVRHTYWALDH